MPLLEMSGITKAFPGVLALEGVSFSVDAGEIRALMGENGAGKSTLIKVLTGVHAPDSGTVSLDGQAISPRSPVHAQQLGVSTVYQEVNLCPNLSVAENVCLGSEQHALGAIRWRAVRSRAKEALEKLDLNIDVRRPLGDCSTAVQQLVAVARALDQSAKVLVLDEPTSSLDRAEVARLFDVLRSLRGQGMAILFVTHFLDQVYAVADTISVLRNGKNVGHWPVSDLSRNQLVAQMLGRELEDVPHIEHRALETRTPLISIDGLGKANVLEPVTFDIGWGETLGLSGLLGSGRTETMKLLFGAIRADSGRVDGLKGGVPLRSPRQAIRSGIGYCSEDRKAEGICPGLSVAENMMLVVQARRGWLRPLSNKRFQSVVGEQIAKLQIKTPDASRPIENLSGGNQQKVLLARWLLSDPKLLLLDEPTRGIDVGSKLEIRKLVTDLAQRGMSFLFTSAELEEVVNTCNRVVVLRDRRAVGELAGTEVNEQNIMAKIAGDTT
jgi:monosaccharide-transporting ATPase